MDIVIHDNAKYAEHCFQNEAEFEEIVFANHREIFGPNSILIKKQKIKTITNIGAIPDAFIIDIEKGEWKIIEVELSTHDVYRHIVPQITKFATAIANSNTRKMLTEAFDREINNDPQKLAIFLAHEKKEVFKELTRIIEKQPELSILLDKEHIELKAAMIGLPYHSKIKMVRVFSRVGYGLGDNILLIDSDRVLTSHKPIDIMSLSFDTIPAEITHKESSIEQPKECSNKLKSCIKEISAFAKTLGNVDVKVTPGGNITHSKIHGGRRSGFLTLQPTKNTVQIILKNGDYPDPQKRFKFNSSRSYIPFKDVVIAENMDYIKKIVRLSFDRA